MLKLKTKLRISNTSKRYFTDILNQHLNKSQYKIAVIGSGPAGFYTSKMLLTKYKDDVSIDIYDKMPHPFGLVRTGIAPDHQDMKNVQKDFLSLLANDNINLLCNVEILNSEDVDTKSLDNEIGPIKVPFKNILKSYSAVILCCGAEGEAKLNLDNEDCENVVFSRDFVNWYNGSIESTLASRLNKFDFSSIKNVIIIGNGNVAIDISRILARDINELAKYDIPNHVIEKLKNKHIENIHIIGRRGAVQSAFSTKEARELTKSANVMVFENEYEKSKNEESLKELDSNIPSVKRLISRKFDFITKLHKIKNPNDKNESNYKTNIYFRYLMSPIKLITNNENKVTSVDFCHNKLSGTAYSQICEVDNHMSIENIKADLILCSIGYKPKKIFSDYFNYNRQNLIENYRGLISFKEDKKQHSTTKVYTSGWMKRGAKGILDETLHDAQETFGTLSSDIDTLKRVEDLSIGSIFIEKSNTDYIFKYDELFKGNLNYKRILINKSRFYNILAFEERVGKENGKISEKITSRGEMLNKY